MPRRAAREIPPPLELECLDVLWRLGESNVRTVQETLAGRRPLAYTTVMTMLERLARKQLVTRRKICLLYTSCHRRGAGRRARTGARN